MKARQYPVAIATLLMCVAGHAAAAENDPWAESVVSPWSLHGFAEAAAGLRTRDNLLFPHDMPLGESRVQVEALYRGEEATWRFKADGIADGIDDKLRGDLREASVSLPLGERSNLRAGRQTLTWGTGDLLFLNDLFPKDWHAFLIGRSDEYLKAPGDALRLSRYGNTANLDLVWMPVFTPDRYVDGTRVAFFDPSAGSLVAAPPKLRGEEPARTLANSELALRVYGLAGSIEWAVYGWRGFSGQPDAFDTVRGVPVFSRLNAWGGSLRTPLAGGIGNLEFAWHDAVDDRRGDNPFVPNQEIRLLAGYEREMFANFTLGAQYYLEWMQDYDQFLANWPFDPALIPDEYRQVATLRLTYRMLRDNLMFSVIGFASPSDADWFLRPTLEYRYSDRLRLSAGANLFGGSQRHTFYGQFQDDSSVFTRLRWSF